MGAYKAKFATAEQIEEINKLWNDGHADALKAFGLDCANAYREGLISTGLKAFGLGVVAAAVTSGISHIVKKRKRAKEVIVLCSEFKDEECEPEEES